MLAKVPRLCSISGALTDCDWLDLDAFLEVSVGGIIIISSWENLSVAESVDEGGSSYELLASQQRKRRACKLTRARRADDSNAELNSSVDLC